MSCIPGIKRYATFGLRASSLLSIVLYDFIWRLEYSMLKDGHMFSGYILGGHMRCILARISGGITLSSGLKNDIG